MSEGENALPRTTTETPAEARPGRRRTLSPEPPPRRGSQHDQLAVFAGRWQTDGVAYGKDEGRIFSDETWEWMSGGFFLVCRFDSRVGDTEHKGICYLAWDETRGTHTCRMIDNLGYDRLYELSVNGDVWSFRGKRERAVYRFSEDARNIDITWEVSEDGHDFKLLCEMKAVRVGGLGPTKH